jgi:hypothetical protein
MDLAGWHQFLTEWNHDLLLDRQVVATVSDEVVATGWLGADGATEEQLLELETYLGRALPPSYRAFLAASNGWRCPGAAVQRLWSTDEVEWFTVRHKHWADAWVQGVRHEGSARAARRARDLLYSALEISEDEDSAIYLLNPLRTTGDGEWEACLFADWLPGFETYPSFAVLLAQARRSQRVRDEHEA